MLSADSLGTRQNGVYSFPCGRGRMQCHEVCHKVYIVMYMQFAVLPGHNRLAITYGACVDSAVACRAAGNINIQCFQVLVAYSPDWQ